MNTTSFTIKDALGFGWAMVREKFFFLPGLFLIAGCFAIMPDIAQMFTGNEVVLFSVKVISIVLSFIVDAGLIYTMLRLRDGKEVKIADLFSQYPIAFQYFTATVLYGCMVSGLAIVFALYRLHDASVNHPNFIFYAYDILIIGLLCIPGVYLMVRYQFYKYFLVDKQMDIVNSFKQSAKITSGHRWQLFRFAIVISGINFLGFIAFVIGLFITLPLSMLAIVYVYRKLSSASVESEPIEDPLVVLGSLDQTDQAVSIQ
jgi:hypothetical protein